MARKVCERHLERLLRCATARVISQQEIEHDRAREFGRTRRIHHGRIVHAAEMWNAESRRCRIRAMPVRGAVALRILRQLRDDVAARLRRCVRARCATPRAIRSQNRSETRPPIAIVRGEIGAAEKRLQLRRQKHRHGPAAAARRRLHERHVDAIDIRPFFAIHFYRHEPAIQDRGQSFVFERLALHHVAPVAGRVADGQKDGLVFGARLSQTPPRPTDTNPPDCGRAAAGRDSSR